MIQYSIFTDSKKDNSCSKCYCKGKHGNAVQVTGNTMLIMCSKCMQWFNTMFGYLDRPSYEAAVKAWLEGGKRESKKKETIQGSLF